MFEYKLFLTFYKIKKTYICDFFEVIIFSCLLDPNSKTIKQLVQYSSTQSSYKSKVNSK